VHLHCCKEEGKEEASIQLVQLKKEQCLLPGQIIVYCDTVPKTKQYAEVSGVVCYHREAGTAKEKRTFAVAACCECRQKGLPL
jgi:hypothetical protein